MGCSELTKGTAQILNIFHVIFSALALMCMLMAMYAIEVLPVYKKIDKYRNGSNIDVDRLCQNSTFITWEVLVSIVLICGIFILISFAFCDLKMHKLQLLIYYIVSCVLLVIGFGASCVFLLTMSKFNYYKIVRNDSSLGYEKVDRSKTAFLWTIVLGIVFTAVASLMYSISVFLNRKHETP